MEEIIKSLTVRRVELYNCNCSIANLLAQQPNIKVQKALQGMRKFRTETVNAIAYWKRKRIEVQAILDAEEASYQDYKAMGYAD